MYPGHEFAFFEVKRGRRETLEAAEGYRRVGAVPLLQLRSPRDTLDAFFSNGSLDGS